MCDDEDTTCQICTTPGCYQQNCPTDLCGDWYGDNVLHRRSLRSKNDKLQRGKNGKVLGDEKDELLGGKYEKLPEDKNEKLPGDKNEKLTESKNDKLPEDENEELPEDENRVRDVCFTEEKRWCGNSLIPEVYEESRYVPTTCWRTGTREPGTRESGTEVAPTTCREVRGWEDRMVWGLCMGVVGALVVGMLVGMAISRYRENTTGIMNFMKKKEGENVSPKSISTFHNDGYSDGDGRVTFS